MHTDMHLILQHTTKIEITQTSKIKINTLHII